jgi:hypothetical protein
MLPPEDVEGFLVAALGDALLEDRRSAHVVKQNDADVCILANGSMGTEFVLHRRQTIVGGACSIDAILDQMSKVEGLRVSMATAALSTAVSTQTDRGAVPI